jgi:hypothetical protein
MCIELFFMAGVFAHRTEFFLKEKLVVAHIIIIKDLIY